LPRKYRAAVTIVMSALKAERTSPGGPPCFRLSCCRDIGAFAPRSPAVGKSIESRCGVAAWRPYAPSRYES